MYQIIIFEVFRRNINRLVLALPALIAMTIAAHAQVTWLGGTAGNPTDWDTGGNWTGGSVPNAATGIAEFNSSFANQPSLSTATGVGGIWVTTGVAGTTTIGGTATLTIAGNNTINGNANTGILLDDTANNSLTISSPIAISNSTSFTVNNAGTLTVGSVALGANTLTLSGSNSAGNISVGAIAGASSTVVVSTSGTVTFANSIAGTLNVAAGTAITTNGSLGATANTVTLGTNGGTANATLGMNGGFTESNPIVVQSGDSGTLTLENAATASHAVGYTGNVALNNNLTLTNLSTGSLTLGGSAGTITETSTGSPALTITNSGSGTGKTTIAGAIVVGSGGLTLAEAANTGTLVVNGGVTSATTGNLTIKNNSSATSAVSLATTTINNAGSITNSGTGSGSTLISAAIGSNVTNITQNSSGTLVLDSNDANFAGSVTVTSGTLQTQTGSALDSSNVVTVNGGTFDTDGIALTIAGLNDGGVTTGTVTNSSANAHTLSLAGSGTYSYGGTITAATPANTALSITGGGTQTLGGTNGYTGATTIANGKLNLTGSLAAGSAVAVGNGTAATAILSGTGTAYGNVTTKAATGGDVAYLAPGVNTSGSRTDFGNAGTLNIGGNLSLGAGTNLDFDLSNSHSSGNDQIAVSGTLTIGTALTFNYNELTSALDTTGQYQLITFTGAAPSLSNVTFTTTGDTGYTAVYSIDNGGEALDVTFTSSGGSTPASAYFNGQGADLGTLTNFDTDVSSGTAVSSALGSTTNVFFNANRNATVSAATLNTALDVNSLTFGTGSGLHSNMTINGTGSITIEATTAGGHSIGDGITVQSGAGNNAINTGVVLGNDQTWTVTDATSTLTLGGQVSGAHKLTTAGSGVVALTNAGGNTYSGGTEVTSPSALYIANTSGSATGTSTLTVDRGATLAGTGIVNATGGAISLGAGGTGTTQVYVGQAVGGDTGTTSKLTLKAASGMSIANTTLTFNLNSAAVGGSGAPSVADGTGASGSGNELVVGTTAVTFGGNVKLQLNLQGATIVSAYTSYVLFAGTGLTNIGEGGTTTGQYGDLTITSETIGGTTYDVITGGLNVSFGGSQPPNWYGNSFLYLNQSGGVDDIEVEVVPEPATWALMLGGLASLVFWQRRKKDR